MTSSTTHRCAPTSAIGSSDGRADRAIVVGGSGQGRAHRLQQKYEGYGRACATTVSPRRYPRAHNDAKRPGDRRERSSRRKLAEELTDVWMTTAFKGGPPPGSARPRSRPWSIAPASTPTPTPTPTSRPRRPALGIWASVSGPRRCRPRRTGVGVSGRRLSDRRGTARRRAGAVSAVWALTGNVPVFGASQTFLQIAGSRRRVRGVPGRGRSGRARPVPSSPRARRPARCRGRTSPVRCQLSSTNIAADRAWRSSRRIRCPFRITLGPRAHPRILGETEIVRPAPDELRRRVHPTGRRRA